MNEEIKLLVSQIEKTRSLFKNKSLVDTLSFPSKIVGREKQKLQLLKYLIDFKQGYVVPCIAVYGKSGSGKSVVVQNVLSNLDEVSFAIADLRQATTLFGATNVILSQLGAPNIQSAQGLQHALDAITGSIESRLQKEEKKLFVLVLDEFDAIFRDTRSSPSDFVFRLLRIGENLKQKGLLFCIIAIANNAMAQYELDERVRSRMGTAEIFFEPYRKDQVLAIITDRADGALVDPVNQEVLEHCAELASKDTGDARKALDLLKVAAECAGEEGMGITKWHVETAGKKIEHDRAMDVLSNLTFHEKVVSMTIAKLTYVSRQAWHSTSEIYNEYTYLVGDEKEQTYRSVSAILRSFVNYGIVVDHKSSRGRYGFGTEYKLELDPEMAGELIDSKWWDEIRVEEAERRDTMAQFDTSTSRGRKNAKRFIELQKLFREKGKKTREIDRIKKQTAELQKNLERNRENN